MPNFKYDWNYKLYLRYKNQRDSLIEISVESIDINQLKEINDTGSNAGTENRPLRKMSVKTLRHIVACNSNN